MTILAVARRVVEVDHIGDPAALGRDDGATLFLPGASFLMAGIAAYDGTGTFLGSALAFPIAVFVLVTYIWNGDTRQNPRSCGLRLLLLPFEDFFDR